MVFIREIEILRPPPPVIGKRSTITGGSEDFDFSYKNNGGNFSDPKRNSNNGGFSLEGGFLNDIG